MKAVVNALFVGMALLLAGCGGNAQITMGKEVYENNCAACHGLQGEGAPNWRVLNPDGSFPAPPHTDEGHTWHHPDGQLYQIVAEGGQGPASAMPAFGETLSHEEIVAVLEYIKTFWSPEIRAIHARNSQQWPYPPAPAE